MTNPVFVLQDRDDLHSYNKGQIIEVFGDQAHHAINVMRMKKGEELDLVDGKGLRLKCEIALASGASFQALVQEKIEQDVKLPRLHIVQALAKNARDEQAVETCTELGIASVTPWQATNCISVWKGSKEAKGVAKWQNIVQAATKQSRQASLAKVNPLATTPQLLKILAEKLDSGNNAEICEKTDGNSVEKTNIKTQTKTEKSTRVFILHESATNYLADVDDKSLESLSDIYIVIGPEGGITPKELDQFSAIGAEIIRLSDTVLRSSSAGAVATVMLATKTGKWSKLH